jgi:hypothetical protein
VTARRLRLSWCYFFRPAFRPLRVVVEPSPALFSARRAAQYARIRSPCAFRASADMPLRFEGWFAGLAAPSEADWVSEALPVFSPRRFAQ